MSLRGFAVYPKLFGSELGSFRIPAPDSTPPGAALRLTGRTYNPNYGFCIEIGTEAGVGVELTGTTETITAIRYGSTDGGTEYGSIAGSSLAPTSVLASDGDLFYAEVDTNNANTYKTTIDVRQARPGWLPGQTPTITNDGDHHYHGNWYTIDAGTQTGVPVAQTILGLAADGVNVSNEVLGGRWNSGSRTVGEVITLVYRLTNTWGTVTSPEVSFTVLEWEGVWDRIGWTPTWAVSLHRLTKNYTGPLLKLEIKDVSPTRTFDIGWVASGDDRVLDEQAIVDACTDGGAWDGYALRYDQYSGTLATSPQAPKIAKAGVVEIFDGAPYVSFDAVDDYELWPHPAMGTADGLYVFEDPHVFAPGGTNNRYMRGTTLGVPGQNSFNVDGNITTTQRSGSALWGVEANDIGLVNGTPSTFAYDKTFTYEFRQSQPSGAKEGWMDGQFAKKYVDDTSAYTFTHVQVGREINLGTGNTRFNGGHHTNVVGPDITGIERFAFHQHMARILNTPTPALSRSEYNPGDIALYEENGSGDTFVTIVQSTPDGFTDRTITPINATSFQPLETVNPLIDEDLKVNLDDGHVLTATVKASIVVSPAAMFADRQAPNSSFFFAGKPETLLDAAGIPVTDGAAVRSIVDLSGEGNNWIAAAGEEPTYDETNSGLYMPRTAKLQAGIPIPAGPTYMAFHFKYDVTDGDDQGVPVTRGDYSATSYLFAFSGNGGIKHRSADTDGTLICYVDGNDCTDWNQYQMQQAIADGEDHMLEVLDFNAWTGETLTLGAYSSSSSNVYNQLAWMNAGFITDKAWTVDLILNNRRWFGSQYPITALQNSPPFAPDFTTTTAMDTPIVGFSVAAGATDADGDTILISSVSAAHGRIENIEGMTFDYTPETGFTGDDTITYRTTDTIGLSNVAMITVTVT